MHPIIEVNMSSVLVPPFVQLTTDCCSFFPPGCLLFLFLSPPLLSSYTNIIMEILQENLRSSSSDCWRKNVSVKYISTSLFPSLPSLCIYFIQNTFSSFSLLLILEEIVLSFKIIMVVSTLTRTLLLLMVCC